MALYENTERGPRARRAFSLARVVHTNFSRIQLKRRLAESNRLVRGYLVAGVSDVRGGVPRGCER